MSEVASIAVGIASWNARDDLLACLARAREVGGARTPLLVVDNGSTDGTAAAVRARFPDAVLHVNPENRGAAGGRNDVFRLFLASDADHLMILDPDVRLEPGAFGHLAAALAARPDVGAVGIKGYYLDRPGVLWCRGGGTFNPWKGTFERHGQGEVDRGQYDTPEEVDSIPACLTCVRREAVAKVPEMDERFFIYHEEAEWNFRIRRAGFRLFTAPGAKAVHDVSTSLGGGSPLFYYYRIRNTILLERLHAPRLARAVFYARYLLGTVPGTLYMLWRSGLPRQARGVLLGLGDALRGRWGRCPHAALYPRGGSGRSASAST